MSYFKDLQKLISIVNEEELIRISHVLFNAYLSGCSIFVIGNGGSATTASHLANDLREIRCIDLCSNVANITAISNDTRYSNIFSELLRCYGRRGDVVIAISSSGNSSNIVEAVTDAKDMGMVTIGLLGHRGGKVRDLLDYAVVVNSSHTQLIEDIHLSMCHFIALMCKDML